MIHGTLSPSVRDLFSTEQQLRWQQTPTSAERRLVIEALAQAVAELELLSEGYEIIDIAIAELNRFVDATLVEVFEGR